MGALEETDITIRPLRLGFSPERNHRRSLPRAGVAAAVPRLILVVARDQVGADVADREFGDVLGHAELAHERAAQVVETEIAAAGLSQIGDQVGPARDAAAGDRGREQQRRRGDRLAVGKVAVLCRVRPFDFIAADGATSGVSDVPSMVRLGRQPIAFASSRTARRYFRISSARACRVSGVEFCNDHHTRLPHLFIALPPVFGSLFRSSLLGSLLPGHLTIPQRVDRFGGPSRPGW
jgi:hypothetical protein